MQTNMIECIPGIDQERSARPVRTSAHSSYARKTKAHLTEQNIAGVRYMNYKESNMREGLAPSCVISEPCAVIGLPVKMTISVHGSRAVGVLLLLI
jgi:hypothetical protein